MLSCSCGKFIIKTFVPKNHVEALLFLLFQCWKTSILNKDGTKDFERGCSLIDYSNMHQPSLSNYSFLDNGSSAYDRAVVEYCLEDYCNDGPFPDFTGGFKSSRKFIFLSSMPASKCYFFFLYMHKKDPDAFFRKFP